MEEVISLTTINTDASVGLGKIRRFFASSSFTHRIMNSMLPQCNTRYVHSLISIKYINFVSIDKTKCIRTRMQKYNYGVGAVDSEPLHLRPYDMFDYVCAFNW